jgi:hypothetical protein
MGVCPTSSSMVLALRSIAGFELLALAVVRRIEDYFSLSVATHSPGFSISSAR